MAFNQKMAQSRTLINDKWEIKNSKSSSKRNKTDLKRIKEYIANLKRDAENAKLFETNAVEVAAVTEEEKKDDLKVEQEEIKEGQVEAAQEVV